MSEHGKCAYCGIKLEPSMSGHRRATDEETLRLKNSHTIDHLTPICRGGKDAASNTVTACRSCNCRKYNRTLAEFRRWIVGDDGTIPNFMEQRLEYAEQFIDDRQIADIRQALADFLGVLAGIEPTFYMDTEL